MKKLALLLLFIPSCLFAQEKSLDTSKMKRHRLSFHLASSNPIGDFVNNDVNAEKSGFAESGIRFSIAYQYLTSSPIYITARYSVYRHSVDGKEMEKSFNENKLGINYRVSSNNYDVSVFQLGVKAAFGNDRIKGYCHPTFGIGYMTVGELEINLNGAGETATVIQRESDWNAKFIYGVDLGVEYYMSKKITLLAEIGIIGANFLIKPEIYRQDINSETITRRNYLQPFSTVDFGIGLGYNF